MSPQKRARSAAVIAAWVLAGALPLIGLVSLLLRSRLDPHFENYRAHFVVFGIVGGVAFVLGFAAGEAAKRRGDARVLLLSLAFMATGGFMGLHAIGTAGVLFQKEYPGFRSPPGRTAAERRVRRRVGVRRLRPELAPWLIQYRTLLRAAVLSRWPFGSSGRSKSLPPLRGPGSEAARGSLLT